MRIVLLILSLTLASVALADTNGLRIAAIQITDDGSISESNSVTGIDVVQNQNCDGDSTTVDPEDFHDSILHIKIRNTLTSEFRALKFYYKVNDGTRVFTSKKFSFLASNIIAKKETAFLHGLFIQARDGRKYFSKQTTPIDPNLGFRNYRVYVEGVDGRGRRYTLTTRLAISFSDIDRC